ncbi:ATP-binding protein [Bradyrhizobium sp. LHD-71]|uniref:ATP-binding protein n=1 Tax=Bradyrhizobium sp. LHD-71 TaxID=3072141 RepID=UPI00280FBC38|nr:ATP-binding protein [Bradyrhizobium sp. LHD-71]MDQ8730616.1 ATP-binding protein [Bradyrhizobium sp. LHD-71]
MVSKRRTSRSGARPIAARRKRPAKAAAKSAAKGGARQQRVVETVLATFAHEVRTPLTGILAISELLATSELGERERRWVDTIKASANHLSALATLFVDGARSQTSALSLRKELFDLRSLTRAAGDSLAGRAAAKGLEATVELANDLPHLVIGDAVRLRAALENLVDNAVKFTTSGDVAFRAAVTGVSKGRVTVRFTIADSGIGVSVAEIKRLFRPFSQANLSIAQRYGGAGLGLSSVRQLARAMGGDVTASPRKGGGALFALTVPFPLAAGADAAAAADGEDVAQDAAFMLRILSVEDNPFGRVVLNAVLNELGHQTEFIGLGETAGERLTHGAFDVVLMDMVLPGINGIEAIRRIRALDGPHGGIAIIGLSGRDEDETAALAAGADAFILKPVSPRALAQVLAKVVRSRRPQEASSS